MMTTTTMMMMIYLGHKILSTLDWGANPKSWAAAKNRHCD